MLIFFADAVPVCVTTAQRVPKHFEPESKKTITRQIKRKVTTPVDETTTWCSPTFFVPKADGKRVRLVTDFCTKNNSTLPINKGGNRGNPTRGQTVLQIGRSTHQCSSFNMGVSGTYEPPWGSTPPPTNVADSLTSSSKVFHMQ